MIDNEVDARYQADLSSDEDENAYCSLHDEHAALEHQLLNPPSAAAKRQLRSTLAAISNDAPQRSRKMMEAEEEQLL